MPLNHWLPIWTHYICQTQYNLAHWILIKMEILYRTLTLSLIFILPALDWWFDIQSKIHSAPLWLNNRHFTIPFSIITTSNWRKDISKYLSTHHEYNKQKIIFFFVLTAFEKVKSYILYTKTNFWGYSINLKSTFSKFSEKLCDILSNKISIFHLKFYSKKSILLKKLCNRLWFLIMEISRFVLMIV